MDSVISHPISENDYRDSYQDIYEAKSQKEETRERSESEKMDDTPGNPLFIKKSVCDESDESGDDCKC